MILNSLKNYIKTNKIIMFFLKNFQNKNKIIKNINRTNYNKNILMLYINEPFLKNKKKNLHSNQMEAEIIAKLFEEYEYNVDIGSFLCNKNISLKKYDVIFGFGDIFEESFYKEDFKGKRIFYATGAEQSFQIYSEINRVKKFNERNNVKLLPKRLPPNFWALSFYMSDAIIMIGNNWTKSTWSKKYDEIILKQIGSNEFLSDLYEERLGKEFVFIGSSGAIHKGLDICIDIFKKLENKFILNIFCNYEEDVFKVYEPLPSNIKFHGFKDLKSDYFKNVLKKSKFILAPSCSEGQMTSLISGIGNGLYPLASHETGVDLPQECYLENINEDYIKDQIENLYGIEDKLLDEKRIKLQKLIRQNHSLKKFEKNFRSNLNILKEKNILK